MKAANVRPITDLKNRTKELVGEVADSGQPVVITQNGKPRASALARIDPGLLAKSRPL
jgi:antitoxin (DNA-binding transcriptional repressor) of toxin-antitoxin stability system